MNTSTRYYSSLMVSSCHVGLFVPACRLGKACCEACPSRLVARVGGVFLAGVRPESPSRSDTFLLLRVAARLRRGGRVGSYVVR